MSHQFIIWFWFCFRFVSLKWKNIIFFICNWSQNLCTYLLGWPKIENVKKNVKLNFLVAKWLKLVFSQPIFELSSDILNIYTLTCSTPCHIFHFLYMNVWLCELMMSVRFAMNTRICRVTSRKLEILLLFLHITPVMPWTRESLHSTHSSIEWKNDRTSFVALAFTKQNE